jgi:hypothetical protein
LFASKTIRLVWLNFFFFLHSEPLRFPFSPYCLIYEYLVFSLISFKMTPSIPPCAACKSLTLKCTGDCVFAPYFPPDQPEKFADMAKLLMDDLPPSQHENVANSLVYEAESSLKDSINGNVDLVAKQLPISSQPQEILQTHEQQQQSQLVSFNGGFNPAAAGDSTQHQSFEAQQLVAAPVAAREQQEILQPYEQQQQQQEKPVSFNSGFDLAVAGNSVTASGFDQTNIAGGGGVMPPSLEPGTFENPYQIRTQQRLLHDDDLQTQLQQLHKQDQTKMNIAGGGGVMSPSLEPGTFENPNQNRPQQREPHDDDLQTQLQQLHKQDQTNIATGGGVMPPSLEPGTLEYPSQLQPQQWEPNEYNLPKQLQKLDQHNQQVRSKNDEKRKGKRVADH